MHVYYNVCLLSNVIVSIWWQLVQFTWWRHAKATLAPTKHMRGRRSHLVKRCRGMLTLPKPTAGAMLALGKLMQGHSYTPQINCGVDARTLLSLVGAVLPCQKQLRGRASNSKTYFRVESALVNLNPSYTLGSNLKESNHSSRHS